MCVAQWEAVRTLLDRAEPAQPLPAALVAITLAPVLDLGPLALASSAELRQVFSDAVQRAMLQLGTLHQLSQEVRCSANV